MRGVVSPEYWKTDEEKRGKERVRKRIWDKDKEIANCLSSLSPPHLLPQFMFLFFPSFFDALNAN